ncbi:hypothetical protein [uncultured Vagococcus sp.]|uniref:hypothetical protein n=1 Tax=uncultured Vagococcus sp. TaxID=189676 RepID=UPI0028D80958|nr:hypothetical protein [uncultured Vagococcus sp.]
MKQQRKKLKVWLMLSTGIAVLGLVGWLKQSDDIAGAEPQAKQNEVKVSKGTDSPRSSLRAIEPIENDGLIAKAKAFTLVKNGKFPTAGALKAQVELMLEKLTLPSGSTAITWKYVDANGEPAIPSSTTTGFQFIYVEITETAGGRSVRVPIPVTITDANTTVQTNKTAFQYLPVNGCIILYPNELNGKTDDEVKELIATRANVKVWLTETGEEVPYSITTTVKPNILGDYYATFKIDEGTPVSISKRIRVFGALKQKLITVAQNAQLSLSTSPTNLFSSFQTVTDTTATTATYSWVNENGEALTKFDSSEVGFKWAYVKMVDKYDPTVSTIIKIGINVFDTETSTTLSNAVMYKSSDSFLYAVETKNKTKKELLALLESKINPSAWDTQTGEPVEISVSDTTMPNHKIGNYKVTLKIEQGNQTVNVEKNTRVFGVDLKIPFISIGQDMTLDMGDNGTKLFSNYLTMSGSQAYQSTYEWVANKDGDPTVPKNQFDTKKAGSHLGYIKITDRTYPNISQVFPIPIVVTNNQVELLDNEIAFLASNGTSLIQKSEIKGKTASEITSYLQEKFRPMARVIATGDSLPLSLINIGTMQSESPMGSYELTYQITLKDNTLKMVTSSLILLPDDMFNGELDDWESIPLGAKSGVVENPINKSKIGYDQRGMSTHNTGAGETGFIVKDAAGQSYTYGDRKVSFIPFVDGKKIYDELTTNEFHSYKGIGSNHIDSFLTDTYYLKKGNHLKQILVDSENHLLYVYDLSLNRNLNFSVYLSTYNLDLKMRKVGLMEYTDTDYYDDLVPIYSLGGKKGFYIKPSANRRFSIKLADEKNEWLSAYTMFAPGSQLGGGTGSGGSLYKYNWFGNDFSRPGVENWNVASGYKYIGGTDTAYQIGAPNTDIQPEKALRTGYELFAGDELPYMKFKANPEVINVYSDHEGESFNTDYTLSKIPVAGNTGTIYINYPNNEEVTVPFVADTNKEFKGLLSIPRRTLPTVLNDGTKPIKSYETSLFAINESDGAMKNLPSEDYAVSINAYHFGATPVAQSVKQGTVWNKTAASLLKDSVILPGHTATYEYVDEKPVDTSKLGLQYAKVRYSDQQDSTKSIVYDVPVNVVAGTVPTTGLTVAGNDFSISKSAVEGLGKEAIDGLILDKSKAIAWDNATGLQTDINLAVTTTTLTAEAEVSKSYTATIRGTKEATTKDATITINVDADLGAEAVPQSVTLGSGASYWTSAKLHDTVKNVMKGNESISDYTVTLVKGPITDRLTETKMTVKLAETASPTVTIDIEVPVTVTWGDSLAIGGSGTNLGSPSKQSTMAITLHQEDEQPFVTTTYGNLPVGSETKPLSGSIGSQPYYQLTHVDLSKEVAGKDNAKELTAGPNSLGEVSLQALGTSTPAQMVGQLGTGGKLNVSYGDVLRLYTVEGFALYTKGEGPTQLTGLPNQTSFVVVTKNGLVPLYLNQLKSKEITIDSESTATKERYEAHYNNLEHYLSLPEGANPIHYVGILPNGFKTYPKFDLAVGEKAQGSVYVAEPTGTSNVYLKFAYTMTFVGSGPELQIVGPLANLNFGTPTIKSHTQEIKRTNPNWSFTVLDSRMKKDAWVIQAKVANPFKTAGGKELRGAGLLIKESTNDRLLNDSFQTIYTKDTPTPSNQVTWSEAEGFFLQVPSGFIEKGADYQTELDILLTNAPTGKD